MDKKVYFAPEVETVELKINNALLSGSLEEPSIGGSGAGYSEEPFDPNKL